jgi:hypothetical protein
VQALGEDALGGRVLDDAAQVEHGGALADVPRDVQIVRDEQVGEPAFVLQPDHQVQHLGLDGNVERRERLIGDDDLGADGEGTGDPDSLPLTAAERHRAPGCLTGR